MARILLTGGSGFVGRQIAAALQAQGHDLVLVLRPGSSDRIAGIAASARVIETADLFAESLEWWQDACVDVDVVVHAAWHVVPGQFYSSPINFNCVIGSLRLAQGAVAAGVRHFVGIGTCMEYRLPSEHLEVTAPLEPSTVYSASKLGLFHMLQHYFAATGTAFSWCRLFHLYGEHESSGRLVPYLRKQLGTGEVAKLSAGTQIRDFLDVTEAGRMIARVVESGQQGAINICSGQPVTIRQMAERIADEYGRRDLLEFGTAPPHPADPPAIVGVPNLKT
ncbi:NAD-dependent epimerase/dehydratase family protein [Rhizobium sp. NRK18]|uniref:NAD-dependent epimerase/dehydratase family protein n=1 Tax=Rhizobium sp. NRK18 TaxID=2964667 RepID=UPI0021C40703|nr:NAD(P)-dependent oxidoreductase [Rhizobium sp. NRK18]MCQ2005414.1 NAD(P)-dependent oxidoreductase [Rhizobium sp. NRK18]